MAMENVIKQTYHSVDDFFRLLRQDKFMALQWSNEVVSRAIVEKTFGPDRMFNACLGKKIVLCFTIPT